MIRFASSTRRYAAPAAARFSSAASCALEIDQGIATLTLTRPEKHNAFSHPDVMTELEDALSEIRNASPRCVFLRAQGKTFSAGGDLASMKRASGASIEENATDAYRLSALLKNLATLDSPTIALVQGPAFGGGVGLISVCDVAVSVKSAHFCLSEVKIGLTPATISPYVVRRIGAAQAKRYFLTAESFSSQKALEIGLVHDVVDDANGLEAAKKDFVSALSKCSPHAVAESKKLIDHVNGKEINETLMRETANRLAQVRTHPEAVEGLTAFLEKRPPSYSK